MENETLNTEEVYKKQLERFIVFFVFSIFFLLNLALISLALPIVLYQVIFIGISAYILYTLISSYNNIYKNILLKNYEKVKNYKSNLLIYFIVSIIFSSFIFLIILISLIFLVVFPPSSIEEGIEFEQLIVSVAILLSIDCLGFISSFYSYKVYETL